MIRRALVLLLVFSACGEEAVPSDPTWVDDVEPIMRGNCFACHGSSSRTLGRERFDVYSLDAYATVGPFTGLTIAGATGFAKMLATIPYLTTPDENIRMPPPPMARLSERDVEVIQRWAAGDPPVRGVREKNHAPRASLLAPPTWENNQLSVSFVIRDADREQVLGKLFVGDNPPVDVLRSGSQTLLVNVDQETAAMRIILRVCDGWNTIDYDLGAVPGH
jgi:hypothetical protein